MATLLDTPSRVLKRVQQYDEMELPSLPSFQRDDLDLSDDYPADSDVEASKSNVSDGYYSTPHVARAAHSPPPTSSTARTESTVKPLRSSQTVAPTPIASYPSIGQLPNSSLDISSDSFMDKLCASDASVSAPEAATQHAYEDYSSLSERLPAAFAGSDREEETDYLYPSALATPMPRSTFSRAAVEVSFEKTPKLAQAGRVPSLSRSEVSSTDNEATTPEGVHLTMRNVDPDETKLDATYDITTGANSASPISVAPSAAAATPAVIRYMDQPSTAARAAATPFGNTAPLRDLTPIYRNRRSLTPSVLASPSVDYSGTPRAPLDDAARRKSHVLSVLNSASLPIRMRSRPSPLGRRMSSNAFQGDVTTEDPTNATWRSRFTADRPAFADDYASNTSAMSLMSQDSAEQGRIAAPYRRGNTSVPDILLANGGAASESNLNVGNRPDAVKIHKKLNMMNQELLAVNSDLAREAEDWRSECQRLLHIMREAGMDVDDEGQVANLSGSVPDSLELASTRDSSGRAASLARAASLPDSGTSEEVTTLRRQLQEAHDECVQIRSDYSAKTAEHHRVFAQIGEDYVLQVETLQVQLDDALAETSALRAQLGSPNPSGGVEEVELRKQITLLGEDLASAQQAADDAEEQLEAAQAALAEAQTSEQATLQQRQEADDAAAALQSQLDEARRDAGVASRRIKDLEKRLGAAEVLAQERGLRSSGADAQLSSAEKEKVALQVEIAELSQQVGDLNGRLRAEQDLVAELSKTIHELEGASEGLKAEALANMLRIADLESTLSATQAAQSSAQAEVESLKNQLSITKLANETRDADETYISTVSSNPAIVEALQERLDAAYRRIGHLTAEREHAASRLATLDARDARIQSLETEKEVLLERLKAREVPSPARWMNSMRTSTPAVHKAISALRTPRTPGPLKDLSWLQSTIDDSNESILRAHVEQLQQELDVANTQLDKNFDRLEEAGLGAVKLAELLAAANAKIAEFEDERAMLAGAYKQSEASLNRGRDRNEKLELALESVHERLASLRENMTAEKERLSEDNRRLRLQLSDMRVKYEEELERLEAEAVKAQEEANDDVADANSRAERLRKEKEGVATQLRKSESLVEELEREASKLHGTIDDMAAALDDLRAQASAAGQTKDEVRSLQAALSETRASLQTAQTDSGRLSDQLRRRVDELASKGREVDALKSERDRVSHELEQFNDDLRVQRRQTAAFGTELELVRREQTSSQTQLARLEATLQLKQADLAKASQSVKEAQAHSASLQRQLDADGHTTAEQRHKFKAQARRLSAQIEYLKAKYARENTFRSALALQKKFLILCVGGMSINEQATLRAIASLGVEVLPPARPRRTFKAVGLAVLALVRARRMAGEWGATRAKRNAGVERK